MTDRTFLVLGGAGLVGYQVVHRIATDLDPDRIVIVSRTRSSCDRALAGLTDLLPDEVEVIGEWGDVFVRDEFSRTPRATLLEDKTSREGVFDDLLGPIDDAYSRSRLAQLIGRYQPDVVVDAVNTATAISYQDVYTSAWMAERDVDELLAGHELPASVVAHDVESLILSLSVPQLIRHVTILHKALVAAGTRLYLKVGTTGTGGMGLNIPYTHSEDRPSAQLLTKSAVAFAHTGLLYLLARTPGGPIVKEVKPGALIGYAAVGHQTIRERGQTVYRYEAQPETIADKLSLQLEPESFDRTADLQIPVVDTGENGVFTKGEIEVITALGQMEFVTPEEIAHLCALEIAGGNTGREVIAALDATVLGPTYRGGVLRSRVIQELRQLEVTTGTHSVALGQLGPPELGKLLWECELLSVAFDTMSAALATSPEDMSRAAADLVESRPALRNTITSVGLPILMPDGATMWRGPHIRIPEVPDGAAIDITAAERDQWADKGWIDLRAGNFEKWRDRFRAITEARPGKGQLGSAGVTMETSLSDDIETGAVVAWVVANELAGYRIK